MTQSRRYIRVLMVLFVVIVGIGTTLLSSFAAPAHAQKLGPGRVGMPGFSGYVSREDGELGIGRLGDGEYGVCLDTGAHLSWPAGTPSSRTVDDPRAAFLLSSYTTRARHNGEVAAALWWAVGGTLRLNSHPERVAAHVAQLHRESPTTYRAVVGWHARMMHAAATLAPAANGYRAPTPSLTSGAVSALGVRSGSGHWVPGAPMTVRVSGARLLSGGTVWRGTTAASARTLRLRPTTHAVHVRVTVSGLAAPSFHLYDAGGATQRVATRTAPVSVTASAHLAAPRVPLVVTKSAETDDPAGMVGVAVAVHRGGLHGPVVDRHTFTSGDISGGKASYSFPKEFVPGLGYTVQITHEPAGWVPEKSTVTTSGSTGLSVGLVDDKVWQPVLATETSAQQARPGEALHDTVTVSDTGGDTLTGGWRLLGPLAPGGHGCSGLDWSKARMAGHGTFTVTGDGVYRVGRATPSASGCYTYVEQLSGNATTRPVPWTTPGMATETTVVASTPRLHTRVSRQRAGAGATLVDRVLVSGLGRRTASAAVLAHWQLLGPLAPRSGRCRGLAWNGAPVAAAGRFTVLHDGTVRVGRHRVGLGGCYTYRERLEASSTSRAVPWTAAGTAPETVTVLPRSPHIPRVPHVPAGGLPAGRSTTVPMARVQVPSVGLDAGLLGVGFQGSDLTPPADLRVGAVWRDGAPLDAVVGTTVLVGHVSDDHDRPGEFHRLGGVRRGQRILTTTHGRATGWRVVAVRLTPKRALARSLFEQGLQRRLVLITCGNEVHYPDGRFHYRSNLVVVAVPR